MVLHKVGWRSQTADLFDQAKVEDQISQKIPDRGNPEILDDTSQTDIVGFWISDRGAAMDAMTN